MREKDAPEGNVAYNYHSIMCVALMWKILTGKIAGKLRNYMEKEKLIPDKQNDCGRGSCGTQNCCQRL